MSDPKPDPRADQISAGSPADRKMTTAGATATGSGAGLAIALVDWFSQCAQSSGWHWVVPERTTLEMAALTILMPFGLWAWRVLGLIGDIITNHLQKDDRT
jgi:hypothetical protein